MFNVGLFGGEHWKWWDTRINDFGEGGFQYRFQHGKAGTVDYVTHKVPVRNPLQGVITLDCEIKVIAGADNPKFWFDTDTENKQNTPGTNPANCRPILYTDDNLSSYFGRWFPALSFIVLKPGRFQMSWEIKPKEWMSVMGRRGTQDLAEWRQAMRAIKKIGVVFGGGFYVSHGVYVKLPDIVEFTCHSLTVE